MEGAGAFRPGLPFRGRAGLQTPYNSLRRNPELNLHLTIYSAQREKTSHALGRICRSLQFSERNYRMRYAGLLVMPAGFILSLAALILFTAPTQRTAFILCGLAVEAVGLVVATRGAVRR